MTELANPTFDDYLREMRLGKVAGVFIDDTGSPGLSDTPTYLHPDRKSWVAVIIPRGQIAEVWEQFPGVIDELQRLTGAREFHFTDIYGGNRDFKGVEPPIRIALFDFVAGLFAHYKFPVLVQTLEPGIVDRICQARHRLPGSKQFDFSNHAHIALVFLLLRVRNYLRSELAGQSACVFVDEGIQKDGAYLRIAGFQPEFRDGLIRFGNSESILPIQLADFAAFGVNRVQLIRGKSSLSEADARLLEIYSGLAMNFINIELREADLKNWEPVLGP
jgi:hypothetical protein